MSNMSLNASRKFFVGALGIALAVSMTSCSSDNKAAGPSPSASASVDTSVSASASASAKPTKKPSAKPTPTPTHTHNAPPAPVKPLAKKPYVTKVQPKPTFSPANAKEAAFVKEFKKQTGLTPEAWDLKVDGDPLTYKLRFPALLSYAKGALCSYIASGTDDFTLGSYISNEISYMTDVQSAVIAATRKGFGCKA